MSNNPKRPDVEGLRARMNRLGGSDHGVNTLCDYILELEQQLDQAKREIELLKKKIKKPSAHDMLYKGPL